MEELYKEEARLNQQIGEYQAMIQREKSESMKALYKEWIRENEKKVKVLREADYIIHGFRNWEVK